MDAAVTPPAVTPYSARARYFDSGSAFNLVYTDVPAASFVAERDAALNESTGTCWIPCDQGKVLGLSYAATSPLILAGYVRVRKGESIEIDPRASVVLGYVISGTGAISQATDAFDWEAGDIFSLPGGAPIRFSSTTTDCVLWIVSNEPQLKFEGFAPPPRNAAQVEVAHFPAATISAELDLARARLAGQERVAGLAVVLSSERLESTKNISPSLTFAMNQLTPGNFQAAHSHNSVAVSLAIEGTHCYSKVNGLRKDWSPFVTLVTPPTSVHSHHNDGDRLAQWLIAQDGGIYYHCRTMGFRFESPEHR